MANFYCNGNNQNTSQNNLKYVHVLGTFMHLHKIYEISVILLGLHILIRNNFKIYSVKFMK